MYIKLNVIESERDKGTFMIVKPTTPLGLTFNMVDIS